MARTDAATMAPSARSIPFNTESTTKWDYASHPSRSPPRTPPLRVSRAAQGKGPGRGPRARPALHDTFFDDGNARGSKGTRPSTNKRDSHDLSWSPKQTRDSVVDNMLLSLDQLFVGGGGSPSQGSNTAVYSAIDENYSVAPHLDVGRQRGHTFSSSLSSDYNMSLADSTTDYPNRSPRGHRRNNSGSNFQSGLQRIDSVYVDDDYGRVLDDKLLETGRATISGDRTGRPRRSGRKGSKSSGSSSLDFGQTLGGPRWQRSVERRSSSFDHGYEKHGALPLTINTYSHSPSMSRSQFDYNDFDEAAPTPTVPAGPRRNRSPPPAAMFGPAIPYAPQMPPTTSSNVTLRRKSSLTHYAKYQSRLAKVEKPPRTSGKQPIKYGKSQVTMDANDASMIAALTDDPSASPAVPLFKAVGTTTRSASIPARERPGFFKRVFGSSWSSNPSPKSAPPPPPPPLTQVPISSRNSIRSESRNGQAAPAPPVSRHSRSQGSGSVPASTKDLPPLPLNKKSSFFRRRKKSVSGEMPLPALPPQIQTELQEPVRAVQEIEPSPVSSLREVMKPFLNRPSSAQLLDKELGSGDIGIHDVAYLAGYAARNESSRKPPVGFHRRTASDSAYVDGSPGEELARETAKAKVDPKLAPHESSYLHDSSSTNESVDDQQTPKARPVAENIQPHHQIISPPPSSAGNDASPPQANDASPSARASTSGDKTVAIHEALPVKQMPLQPVDPNVANGEAMVPTPKKPEPKYILTPVRVSSKRNSASLPNSPNQRASRLWLDPISTTDVTENPKQPSTPKYSVSNSARQSIATIEDFKSASSQLASPVYETPITRDAPVQTITEPSVECPVETSTEATLEVPNTEAIDAALDAPEFDPTLPTEHDRLLAKQIYDGTNEEIKPKAAPWLGDVGSERGRVRRAYMELFDWQNLNILAGLRALCNRLFLKGETQQIDRILTAFSTRWCECNPNHGFKATDVVHTICYSILLLNTDLHMADIESKMTRTQFIKNTMPSIRRVAADAAPDAFETGRASIVPPLRGPICGTEPSTPLDGPERRPSLENKRPNHRLSTRPSDYSVLDGASVPSTPLDYDTPQDDCGLLVKTPFQGRLSTWEVQVEIVLKDFYNSIRQQRLPVQGDEIDRAPEPTYQAGGISGIANNILRRTGSTLSKTGSENTTMRGRFNELRNGPASRWSSKNRSRPRLLQASTMPSSSRTSLDDGSSIMSPSASSTWSRYSYGKTQTSMSVDSFGSSFPNGDYKQSIGFANALSQAIIREEAAANNMTDEITTVAPLFEDESLELAGAPWAKEGILKHKHHLESVDKKAKDRNWTECFAVVEKGWMQLFSFNMNAKSMRQKARNQKAAGGVVGGGNWAENAEPIGKYLLRQTIASALPPPGYSKARPHVWALSLPTGAVHLFQVGTPEIVKEFVSTANYWSARLSKEPLVGGVSNMEYGWSEHVINTALLPSGENTRPPSNPTCPRPSLQSSIRSSIDHPGSSSKPRLPGDRILISDWTPPQQSMLPSALMEVDQLKGLSTYVKNIEDELQRHNELRSVMLLAFSPRHPNHARAMGNWERKSSYLLREIVKFRTYIDCLVGAQGMKEKVLASKETKREEEVGKETGKQE